MIWRTKNGDAPSLTTHVPRAVQEEFNKLARKKGLSMASLLRVLIQNYFLQHGIHLDEDGARVR